MNDDALVLFTIAVHQVNHGRAPRVSEIAEATGLHRQVAKQAVRRLRALGQLRYADTEPVPYLRIVR